MKGQGRIIGIDLLEMVGMNGVTFCRATLPKKPHCRSWCERLRAKADLVLSDMSPNITGVIVSDQARIYYLAELALEFSAQWLQPDGAFLVKVFQGAGFEDFMKQMRRPSRLYMCANRKHRAIVAAKCICWVGA
jgi:23S rRNA (uridine2552-2'-O)-methyltransferase